jgi:hypothetical protein
LVLTISVGLPIFSGSRGYGKVPISGHPDKCAQKDHPHATQSFRDVPGTLRIALKALDLQEFQPLVCDLRRFSRVCNLRYWGRDTQPELLPWPELGFPPSDSFDR